MKYCEIYPVARKDKNAFRWKWRHTSTDGRAVESKDSYALYYECMMAARAAGYEPRRRIAATQP